MTGTTKHKSLSRFDLIEIEFPPTIRTEFVVNTTIRNEQVDLQISRRRAAGTLLTNQQKNLLAQCASKLCPKRYHTPLFQAALKLSWTDDDI